MDKFNLGIDLSEEFPHLSKAPIVEAVIDIRSISKSSLAEGKVSSFLKERLADYPTQKSKNSKSLEIAVGPKAHAPIIKDLGFAGSVVRSTSEPYIAQFNKESFVFSRLSPYNEWKLFMAEALRLWKLYCELTEVEEIQRIGVRFVNKIDALKRVIELSDYYENAPDSIKNTDWDMINYMHKDTYQPTPFYLVNVVRAVKQRQDEVGAGLILDIDVIMNRKFSNDLEKLTKHLVNMKWLKNKTFFNSLKSNVIEEYK